MEVGEAGRHVPGGATAPAPVPATRQRQQLFNRVLDGRLEVRCLQAPVQVALAACLTFHGAVQRYTRGEAIPRPSAGNHDEKMGALDTPHLAHDNTVGFVADGQVLPLGAKKIRFDVNRLPPGSVVCL